MMSAKKIDAILPLNFMQQALLIHSLTKGEDQGFLQVQCRLEGPLEIDLLKEAWQRITAVHAAFRTSIHWEGIEKPVQVIHPDTTIYWEFHNWDNPVNDFSERLQQLRASDRKQGLNLSRSPISRLTLINVAPDSHILIWTCHHILFDGWSGGVVFKDVFECYHALNHNMDYNPEPTPDYGSFLQWLESIDSKPAMDFWKDQLDGLKAPSLVGSHNNQPESRNEYINHALSLPEETTQRLNTYLRNHRLTLNSLLVALWGIMLNRLCNTNDVVFGVTVSGRSMAFPKIERLVGLLMNVLPVRLQINTEQQLLDFFGETQKRQSAASNFEHVSQKQIASWVEWPGHIPMLDSLVVVQNLLWRDMPSGKLVVKQAQGGLTTTYPLTLIVGPGKNLQLDFRYDKHQIDSQVVNWLGRSIITIIGSIDNHHSSSVGDISELLEAPPIDSIRRNGYANQKLVVNLDAPFNYRAPTNSDELGLTKVWEELFGRSPIGVTENFFHCGGNSVMAIQLLSGIEKYLGRRLSPAVLLQNPTIESMVKSWRQDIKVEEWSSLVPMRASGSKPPLFVIHGGGGHIFFYQPLVDYLDSDQPVYALQPLGLDGEQEKHQSIESMAAHYLEVILQICPFGPFSILGSCFSDPVCVEISEQIPAGRKSALSVIIADSAPTHLFEYKIIKVKTPMHVRKAQFKDRFRRNPALAVKKMIGDRIKKRLKGPKEKWEYYKTKYSLDLRERRLLAFQDNLMKLYFRYKWSAFKGKITLIRTSQNVEQVNNHDDEIWQQLALDGVNVLVAEGSHRSRFEEPDVIALAKCLQKHLDKHATARQTANAR